MKLNQKIMFFKNAHFITSVPGHLFLLIAMLCILAGCDLGNDDDNGDGFTGEVETYELQPTSGSDVSGAAIFEELEDGSTLVTLELTGTTAGGDHPAHIHNNSAAEGGGIAIPLNNVDGDTGISETTIQADDADTGNVTYSDLLEFDGHVNVHLSSDEMATIIARGDIGGNALTGESTTYELHEVNESGISGEVHFEERNNGNTLATIELIGTPMDGSHPAHIHNNSVAEGGGIAVPFNNVDGETGISMTNIRADETDAGDLTYSALLEFNGHVNVHNSDDDFSVVAQGDIGANYGEESVSGNEQGGTNDGNGDGNGY